jgi:hypothetical protein
MIDEKQLEELMRVNGLAPSAAPDEMRNVLLASGYTEEEIQSYFASKQAQQNIEPAALQKSGARKLFRTNERLQPAEISQLLGVNVVVKEVIMAEVQKEPVTMFQFMVLWLTSVVLAAAAVTAYMYTEKMGMFHPVMDEVSLDK